MEKKQLRIIGKSRRTMVVVTNSIDLLFPIITETMYLLNMHLALPSSALFTDYLLIFCLCTYKRTKFGISTLI